MHSEISERTYALKGPVTKQTSSTKSKLIALQKAGRIKA